jgi:DNA repair exonuclease SbcCD nuclease subunit
MKCKFLHVSDVHLGFQQYNLNQRFNDFGRAFEHIVDQALAQRVDFVVLGGDLFQKRAIDPPTLIQAVSSLGRLRQANIPVLAVEGNHERAYYRDVYSWTDFLADQGYLAMLAPTFEDGQPVLKPWDGVAGAYRELAFGGASAAAGRVRIYGAKYYGAQTDWVVERLVQALGQMDHSGVDYVILIMHLGLEGVLEGQSATVAHHRIAPLRDYVNYLALGHIHKPYEREGWMYNPGSPETCSMDEVAWPERGYYLVEVDTAHNPRHRARLVANPRRPFLRLVLKVDTCTNPEALFALADQHLSAAATDHYPERPVVELALEGVLPFQARDLDTGYLEEMAKTRLDALAVRIANRSVPAEYEINADTSKPRAELEREVLRELVERDARYRPAAAEWADLIQNLKRMVREGSSPPAIAEYLQQRTAHLQEP